MAPRSAAEPVAGLPRAGEHFRAGEFRQAERICRSLVAGDPAQVDALHLLGVLCARQGAPAEAAVWLARTVSLRPDLAQAWENLGSAHLAAKRAEDAAAAFETRLALGPPTPGLRNNLGNALLLLDRAEAAVEQFNAALALAPGFPPARFNLARALERLHRFQEAEAALRAVLPHAPPDRHPHVINLLGRVLCAQNRHPEALRLLAAIPPDHPEIGLARWNRSLVRLLLGDMPGGWQDYEARWQVPDHGPPPAGHRVLDPAAIRGRRVLVVAEQGLGDSIQFVRHVRPLVALGAAVWLSVPSALVWLFRTLAGVRGVVATGDPVPPPEITTAMMSLPLAFRTRLETIPATVPYLGVPPHAQAAWRDRIAALRGLHIGIVWSGSAASAPRSALPLARLGPLLALEGATFHCLQQVISPEDRAWLADRPAIRCHDTALRDFADTAALLSRMDLVISIDTAVAHLAGAMGRPLWLLLGFEPDWRWMLHRPDTPWYPSVRLFRQPVRGDWDPVIEDVRTALSRRITRSGTGP